MPFLTYFKATFLFKSFVVYKRNLKPETFYKATADFFLPQGPNYPRKGTSKLSLDKFLNLFKANLKVSKIFLPFLQL